MNFITVKTRKLVPPKDDIYDVFEKSLPALKEGDVIFITSKVLAIHQGLCIKISPDIDKDKLVIKEADYFVRKLQYFQNRGLRLTIKNYTLIAQSGIDESNGNGYYILWPRKINQLAREITSFLKKKYKLKRLAVVVTDSRLEPLRHGVIGISVGFFGLHPLIDYRGKKDIFSRKLKMTQANIVDSLSAMSVLLMGEGNECTPIVIARGLEFIKFTNQDLHKKLVIDPKHDIYSPLLKNFIKKK